MNNQSANRFLVIVGLVLIAAQTRSAAADTYVEGFDWHAHDPLVYEHLVIEATIADVVFKAVDAKILDPGFQHPQTFIGVLELSNIHVLRGAKLTLPINVELFFDWRNIVGQRVILCARWWPRLDGYLVLKGESVVVRKNGRWERMEPHEVFSNEELKSLMSPARLEEIAKRADLILAGVVAQLEDSTVTEDGKFRGTVKKVTIKDIDVLAGASRNRKLVFETYDWVARVPTLQIGERWLAFLERTEGGWRVISGLNGVLKEGINDELLLDGTVPLSRSRSQIVRMVGEVRN